MMLLIFGTENARCKLKYSFRTKSEYFRGRHKKPSYPLVPVRKKFWVPGTGQIFSMPTSGLLNDNDLMKIWQ